MLALVKLCQSTKYKTKEGNLKIKKNMKVLKIINVTHILFGAPWD